MKTNGRYEIKFVLDEIDFVEAMRWQHHCTSVTRKYSERRIHNIYFDDNEFQSVRDNLAGIADRQKSRLRWYENKENEISNPQLEIKRKTGRLGCKYRYLLPEIQNRLPGLRFTDMGSEIRAQIVNTDFARKHFDHDLRATLYVNYSRNYYESYNGIRITTDHKIRFYYISPDRKIHELRSLTYPHRIMELKFHPDMKNEVAGWLNNLSLAPTRYSKYITGLAMFGQVKYL